MPRSIEPRRIAFDVHRFLDDLRVIVRKRGMTITSMAAETGVNHSSLSYMQSVGSVPDGVSLAALCKWSGLDAGKYSLYVERLDDGRQLRLQLKS